MDTHEKKFQKHWESAQELFASTRNDIPQLEKWGFREVGSILLGEDKRLMIRFDDGLKPDHVGVYAFVAGKTVVRTGSSASISVACRLEQYPTHINRSYHEDVTKPTPKWESELSLLIMSEFALGELTLWSRKSTAIDCDLGLVDPTISCKVEESIICREFQSPRLKHPVLNRSGRIT